MTFQWPNQCINETRMLLVFHYGQAPWCECFLTACYVQCASSESLKAYFLVSHITLNRTKSGKSHGYKKVSSPHHICSERRHKIIMKIFYLILISLSACCFHGTLLINCSSQQHVRLQVAPVQKRVTTTVKPRIIFNANRGARLQLIHMWWSVSARRKKKKSVYFMNFKCCWNDWTRARRRQILLGSLQWSESES